MVNCAIRRKTKQRGQSVVLLILAVSAFLMVALGLAIDGSQLYGERQMAQRAVDAAAQAGIVTIFDGGTAIGTSAYYCTSSDTTSPCWYAKRNGYTAGTCTALANATVGSDCIMVDPNPGVTVSNLDAGTPNELQVTLTRAVPMTLMKLLGISSLNVTAQATAAIVDVQGPVPILVTDPWCGSGTCPWPNGAFAGSNNAGPFDLGGTGSSPKITICGGPQRSIQVNSTSPSSLTWNGGAKVDLSDMNCGSGTGTDFGDFGGPSTGSSLLLAPLGSTEHFVQPADPLLDPLSSISPPSSTGFPTNPATTTAGSANGCPIASCTLYHPGYYTSAIDVKNQTALFAPGIYYMYGVNFTEDAGGIMQMATNLTDTTTGTSWTGNILVYMTGPTTTSVGSGGNACSPAVAAAQIGVISVGANGAATLVGSPDSSSYKGILFWVDRSAVTQVHNLGGGGAMSLTGTIYMPETVAQMGSSSSAACPQLQALTLQGSSGSATTIFGEIIVSTLHVQGNAGITMNLSSVFVPIRQIALVNGE